MGDRRVIAASAVDKAYGLRHGTAATAARAGLVKASIRAGRGRYGRVVMIDAPDADLRWGTKNLTATTHAMEPAHV